MRNSVKSVSEIFKRDLSIQPTTLKESLHLTEAQNLKVLESSD